MYIAAAHGQTTPGDNTLMSTETFVTLVICYKFQKISLKSDFIHFIMILYMYITPGQRLTTPLGTKFDVNRNILSLRSFVASFKKSLWSLILYILFMMLYMYTAPGQGQTSPKGQSFDVNRNVLSLHSFVASFKKNVFEFWLYTFLFLWFNTYI